MKLAVSPGRSSPVMRSSISSFSALLPAFGVVAFLLPSIVFVVFTYLLYNKIRYIVYRDVDNKGYFFDALASMKRSSASSISRRGMGLPASRAMSSGRV